MLNYISAEFYKLRHRKGLWLSMVLLLLLEGLVLMPGLAIEQGPGQEMRIQGAYLAFLIFIVPIGLFIAPIFAVLTFDDQYGHETLKNEIVYGVPRSRIYVGKLAAAAVTGTLCALVIVAVYLLGMLFFIRKGETLPQEGWVLLAMSLVTGWFTWLSALCFTMLLLFLMKSPTGAMLTVYLLSLIGIPLAFIGYETGSADPRDGFFYWFSRLYYAAPYRLFWNGDGEEQAVIYGLLLFLGWLGVTTALALTLFRRREVK